MTYALELLTSPEAWVALVTLAALEIVLGIDNIIFLTILVGRVPPQKREQARVMGLGLAMLTRIMLLVSLAWLAKLTDALFVVLGNEISWRDIILGVGGLFLIAKSTMEVHSSLEGEDQQLPATASGQAAFISILVQIAVIDIVFSLDSVITAVGMAKDIPVMVAAIMIAVGVMMFAAKSIGDFVDQHPTIKVLALSFLILIGTALVAESLDFHIPKAYIYFAMFFSVTVEMLNIRMRKRLAGGTVSKPVDLRDGLLYPDDK
jgi:predicted tellurium resistance membrane protein TerC